MAFRKKVSRRKSKRMFTKGAKRTHKRNLRARPMRGGFQL